jgi:hypothetical protein
MKEEENAEARMLVERAVHIAIEAPSTNDKEYGLPSIFLQEMARSIEQDRRIREAGQVNDVAQFEFFDGIHLTEGDMDIDLQLEQLRMEKMRRKIAIQAFQRQLQRQMQRLHEMAKEVQKREGLMEAAFDTYERMVKSMPEAEKRKEIYTEDPSIS